MIKNIIFDMDGVLIKSMKNHVYSWKKALKDHKTNINEEEFYLNEGANYRLYLSRILKENNIRLTKKGKQKIIDEKTKLFKERKFEEYKIQKYLKKLKEQNIKLIIATGARNSVVKEALKLYFKDYFNDFVCGDDIYRGKPFPETYNKAIKKLKAKKEETLVIENAPLGIESAKRAGLKVYAIETTLPKKYLKEADKVFKNHKELFEYLFSHDIVPQS